MHVNSAGQTTSAKLGVKAATATSEDGKRQTEINVSKCTISSPTHLRFGVNVKFDRSLGRAKEEKTTELVHELDSNDKRRTKMQMTGRHLADDGKAGAG